MVLVKSIQTSLPILCILENDLSVLISCEYKKHQNILGGKVRRHCSYRKSAWTTISFQFYKTFEKVPDSPIFRKQLDFLDDQMPVNG